jgi:hypothetical protein
MKNYKKILCGILLDEKALCKTSVDRLVAWYVFQLYLKMPALQEFTVSDRFVSFHSKKNFGIGLKRLWTKRCIVV